MRVVQFKSLFCVTHENASHKMRSTRKQVTKQNEPVNRAEQKWKQATSTKQIAEPQPSVAQNMKLYPRRYERPENIESLLLWNGHRNEEKKPDRSLLWFSHLELCAVALQRRPTTAFILHSSTYGGHVKPQYYGHHSEIVCNCFVAFSFFTLSWCHSELAVRK